MSLVWNHYKSLVNLCSMTKSKYIQIVGHGDDCECALVLKSVLRASCYIGNVAHYSSQSASLGIVDLYIQFELGE
jgi:hypothetical protein